MIWPLGQSSARQNWAVTAGSRVWLQGHWGVPLSRVLLLGCHKLSNCPPTPSVTMLCHLPGAQSCELAGCGLNL